MERDYSKTIVVDFDDTLCQHINGNTAAENIPMGLPNVALIFELNRLYNLGYYILVLTARGWCSCDSREEAQENYEPVIREYLDKYGLKYNEISFDKPLGLYYIDDKALRPDETHVLKEL